MVFITPLFPQTNEITYKYAFVITSFLNDELNDYFDLLLQKYYLQHF